jgi:hypothetical protein
MAVAAATVWEVRPTVGSDTNGGGFVAGAAGTDFSQQNAKNSGGNNSSTTDVVATGIATITSATASFTSAIVGNIIYLSGSGITAGWYQVVTFTNATTVILDSSPGTGTGVTMNIGGALATIAAVFITPGAVACNIFWIKATGSLTVTAALTPSFQNNPTPMMFIGYGTVRGDGVRATWTTATNSIHLVNFQSGAENYLFQNLNMSSTAGTPGDGIRNNNTNVYVFAFYNCKLSGFAYGINGNENVIGYFDDLLLDGCEITGCVNSGVVNSSATFLIGCYLHGNAQHGLFYDGGGLNRESKLFATRCVFYNNGGSGANLSYGSVQLSSFVNCVFVSNTADGLTFHSGFDTPVSFVNNIFVSNGGYGINMVTTNYSAIMNHANAFYGNTSGAVSNALMSSSTDVTLSGSPFNAPTSNDFSLNGTAGAGAACKSAGYSGGTLFSAQTNALDIGAVQSAGSGGGGGGTTTVMVATRNVTQVFVQEGY